MSVEDAVTVLSTARDGILSFPQVERIDKARVFLRRLVAEGRRKTGRKPRPTVTVIDSQSVRSGYAQSQKGVDGFKKVKGIKRQILVDSNGFPLLAEVATAIVHDSKGVSMLLKGMRLYYQSVSLVKLPRLSMIR